MSILQKVPVFYFGVLLISIFVNACGGHHSKTESNIEITEESENKEIDTLSFFQTLPDAPLITTYEANRSNPSYTGHTPGWEKRLNNAYADSLHHNLKTLLLEDPWAASETAEALRNDIYPQIAPVLLAIKWPLEYIPKNYWERHSFESAVAITSFDSELSKQYDCSFGPYCLRQILEASYPIQLKDPTRFRPIISLYNEEEGTLYSPLFECFYRGKPFLICSFDVETLKTTDAGSYLWDIIRNYTYSSHFRDLLQWNTISMDYDTWFETLVPNYLDL